MTDDHSPSGPTRREALAVPLAAAALALPVAAAGAGVAAPRMAAPADTLLRHRFGVNYVPSGNWYFCYNDWKPEAIRADLARIAELGADHIRVMVIWPWFQPNPTAMSEAHLDRLDTLMRAAAAAGLDVFPSVFTGWLSGYRFNPCFYDAEPFYTSAKFVKAQDFYVTALSRRLVAHRNFAGFCLGNELGCNWKASPRDGDAWTARMLERMQAIAPGRLHVNGVDHTPWFSDDTFSAKALVARQRMVALHCWPYWTGAGKFGGPLDKPYTHLIAGMAALARSIGDAPTKPMWAQEFGACNVEMPEADVPRFMERAIEAGIEHGVSWFTWWSSHDVSRRFDFNPFEYTLGLIDDRGRIKPQGRRFRALADRYRGTPVHLPDRVPPPPTVRSDAATWAWLLEWMDVHPKTGATPA